MLFHFHQLLALAFLQSRDRNVRPAGDDFGDVFLGHFFAQQTLFCLRRFRGELAQFLFQLRNAAVLDLAGFGQFAAALGALEFGPQSIEFLLHISAARRSPLSLSAIRPLSALDFSFSSANSFSSFFRRSLLAGSFSFFSACRSISSCMISRSITSISVGIESSSIFRREAASSTRSTALSGKKSVADVAMRKHRRRDERARP